jgi:hypothetical protein
MLKRLMDGQAKMVRLAAWAPAGSDGRSREEAATDGVKVKILRLQELIVEVQGQVKDVNINLSETEEVVEPWVDLLERAALRLAETKD